MKGVPYGDYPSGAKAFVSINILNWPTCACELIGWVWRNFVSKSVQKF